MRLVRFLIVLFFLAVVPAAAAVDAVAPQFLDAAMGRKPRGAPKKPAPWEGDAALILRTGAKAAAPPLEGAPAANLRQPIAPNSTAPASAAPLGAASPRNGAAENTTVLPRAEMAVPPRATAVSRPLAEPVFRAAAGEEKKSLVAEAPPVASMSLVAAATDSQLLAIQNHLSQLGATYMRLETTGGGAHTYRFLCQMQLSPSKTEVAPFEATAGDPLEAMHKVLADVEAWQATEITRLQR